MLQNENRTTETLRAWAIGVPQQETENTQSYEKGKFVWKNYPQGPGVTVGSNSFRDHWGTKQSDVGSSPRAARKDPLPTQAS